MFMIEVWPCTSRRVGMSFSPHGKRCAPGGGLDGVRTPSSKAKKCPACGRAMKKNGRTGKGTQRWKCRACRLSSTMPQRGRRRARTLEEFLSWLPGPSSQTASESTGDAHALRKRIAWCWSIRPRIAPPDTKRHTVMADGTYMGHGWRLIMPSTAKAEKSSPSSGAHTRSCAAAAGGWRNCSARGTLRLSRAGACRRWAGGAHHEPAGGRRQLGRQERVAQPADCPRSTCSARANGCAT